MGLLNLRNALMAGKRLPYDAEVEFLQSSETQYIDIDASKVATASRYVCSGQYMVNSNQAMIWSHRYRGVRLYGSKIGFVTGRYQAADTTVLYNVQCTSHFDSSTRKGILYSGDGTELANVDLGTSSASGVLRLFAASPTAAGYVASSSRISTMQVYDASGGLLLDFIPVRKGTVGYMYDRVSGKLFGNAGTGDFVVGPDVVPVEWLSSDGNQYIDTGYVFQFGDDVSATFQPLATPTQTAYFLGADTVYNAGFNVHYDPHYSSDGLRYCYGGGFTSYNTGIVISPVQDFSTSTIYACNGNANKRTINSGENTASVQDSGLNSASVILFCGRRNANVRPASTGWAVASRFFGFDATRNGAGVRAMKPVRVGSGSTWEGAMMDVLTRRIYRNVGTGAFTYGNDLKYPIPAE